MIRRLLLVSEKLCSCETVGRWILFQYERDGGRREGSTTTEKEHISALERENKELRRTNGILAYQYVFCQDGVRPPEQVNAFIEVHRGTHGVEQICRALQRASSAYYRFKACLSNPSLRLKRVKSDDRR